MSEDPLIGVPVLNLFNTGEVSTHDTPPREEAVSLPIPNEKLYFTVCSLSHFSWAVTSALVSFISFFSKWFSLY